MVKVHYDSQTGQILGYYPDDIDYTHIPDPYIEIDEATHWDCIQNPGLRKVDMATKQIVTCEPPAPTKDQLLAQLDFECQLQFDELKLAWAAAQLDGNTALVSELQAEYQALKQEYQTKREAIING